MIGISPRCPLCGDATSHFSLKTGKSAIGYHRCETCGFIGMEPSDMPCPDDEKARYLLHSNLASNAGYMEFLKAFIDKTLTPYKQPGAKVLDFGSGPSPLLAESVNSMGYRCDLYDPFFAPSRAWETRHYDAILLHEVAEHLHDPGSVLSVVAERVMGGGIIAIRTRFMPEAARDFQTWWYRMDRTHVSFFSASCLQKFFELRGFTILLLEKPDILVFEHARYKDLSWS
ncbi:MAG: hypothetical protein CVV53_00485 [Spirochaetae bacterium HGW-Spirochaetae-9]|nr:MAG: hypothetical protein CVV53_00485 [Spirochaetae bacterium HGW-Spirochaetae-9]